MWACTELQWQHLYDDVALGSRAYAKLKAKFSASNFSRWVTLWQEFYGCQHDPSKPIDIFVQNIIHGRAQLKVIGIDVDDASVKDIILMNLDSSYHAIKMSLLTQTIEPSLETIWNILTSSANNMVSADITLMKSEPTETALIIWGQNLKPLGHLSHGDRKGSSVPALSKGRSGGNWNGSGGGDCGNSGGGKKYLRGYMWCDPSNEGNCFWCSHPGHFATRCHVNMPPEIHDWVKTEDHTEHSMWVRPCLSPSSSHSQSHHNCSPSPSLASSCYDSS